MARNKKRTPALLEKPQAVPILTKTVKAVVEKFDPESYVQIGIPKSEYGKVTKLIVEALWRELGWSKTTDEIANIIALSFHIAIMPWSQPVRMYGLYYDMAKELKPLLPEVRRR